LDEEDDLKPEMSFPALDEKRSISNMDFDLLAFIEKANFEPPVNK